MDSPSPFLHSSENFSVSVTARCLHRLHPISPAGDRTRSALDAIALLRSPDRSLCVAAVAMSGLSNSVTDNREVCFAFGSNLDADQLHRRCPSARILSVGRVDHHKLCFAGHSARRGGGVATLRPSMAASTPGVLFDVDARDLAALDRFEGHPFRYQRRRTMVLLPDGSERPAWVYVLPMDVPETKPSETYVATIRRGYERHGLDVRTLDAAVRVCARVRVFVYGTLMRGEANHRWLGSAQLLDGSARTAPCYELHDLGAYPALAFAGTVTVVGELYAVDPEGLARLDELEGYPGLYGREDIYLEDGSSAVAYVMPRSRLAGTSLGVVSEGDWRLRRSRDRS